MPNVNVIVTAEVVDDSEVADFEIALMRKLRRHLRFSQIKQLIKSDSAIEQLAAAATTILSTSQHRFV